MKKYILRLAVTDEREKRKAMKIVSTLPGIDEIAIDMKGQTLTIIGTVDPVSIVGKLRKFWQTHIISVGPAKEPEKKEEPKKEEPKKEEAKKEEAPKEEPKKEEGKKEEAKKEEPKKEEEKKAAPAPFPAPTPIPPQLLAHLQGQVPVIAPGHVPYIGNPMQYRPYYPPMQTYYYPNHSIEENPNACVIC